MAYLKIIEGGTIGREFPLKEGISCIGRWDTEAESYPDVDVSDEDIHSKISRKHAKIIYQDNKYFIQDCKSRNKTFVNNIKDHLEPEILCELNNEDIIKIGKIFFKFCI